jgi:small subunit ribosomal protein S1
VNEETEDFAAMFEASLKARPLKEGQAVDGTIVAIGPEVAFVDVGGKGEATIDVGELKDHEGHLDLAVGDRIHAMVVSTTGGLRLSRRLARGAAADAQLEDAFRARLPVEGRVEKVNKGGYDVRIGHHRAFCPISQIDSARTDDPAVHVGKVYAFRIVEYREGGENLVVSRRALLEQEQRDKADEVRRSIVPGAVLTGRVASVPTFGAFVDFGGGVQGLLHVSEMGWSRVTEPSELFKPGDAITVKVLRLDEDGKKIALGLKQLTADPWSGAADRYHVGDVVTGRITRVAEFGAFVELEPGVEALIHASTFAPTGRKDDWRSHATPGAAVVVEILAVDVARQRIGVALVPEGSARARAANGEPQLSGGEPPQGFGSLADKLRGALEPKS